MFRMAMMMMKKAFIKDKMNIRQFRILSKLCAIFISSQLFL